MSYLVWLCLQMHYFIFMLYHLVICKIVKIHSIVIKSWFSTVIGTFRLPLSLPLGLPYKAWDHSKKIWAPRRQRHNKLVILMWSLRITYWACVPLIVFSLTGQVTYSIYERQHCSLFRLLLIFSVFKKIIVL